VRDVFSSRWFRITVLLWVVGFFVVFVPAHRRGIVTLSTGQVALASGVSDQKVSSKPYCPLCMPWSSADGSKPAPADAPAGCAICHLKANLDLPPTIALAPALVAELEFLIRCLDLLELSLLSSQHGLRGRAPPVA